MKRVMKLLGVGMQPADVLAQFFHVLGVLRNRLGTLPQPIMLRAERRLLGRERIMLGAKIVLLHPWRDDRDGRRPVDYFSRTRVPRTFWLLSALRKSGTLGATSSKYDENS